MSKKTTKSTKTTKPAAKKAAARAKIEQRLVTLSGSRPKKASSTPTLPAARPSKTGAKKKSKPKKVIAESRGATLSAPRSKPAHKPASKRSPSTIVPSQDNASAPYYPDHAPKGEERDFAPMVGYFDKATSVQDLRERMLFRRALGDHPEDVLVAGERKARAMGWSIDAIEVEQPEEAADEPEELASSADEPQRSDATSSAGEPEELTTSADESAQPMEAVSEQPEVSAIESSEVSAVEPVQSTASAAALDQQEAQTHENVLPVTAPEHTATPEEAVP
jgi:hypothetical protein